MDAEGNVLMLRGGGMVDEGGDLLKFENVNLSMGQGDST